jgi:drug/metabolite transporter (DMT)-like permease
MRYILLTVVLTLVYVAMVVLATQVLPYHTPVALAAATLAAALVFNLPRRRLQRAVSRRYHHPA